MQRAAALCLLSLLWSGRPPFASPEDRGDRAFRHRAAGYLDHGAPMSEPTEAAIAAYEEALSEDPDSLRALCKLMHALYFQGYFLTEDASVQREIYERLLELATRSVDLAAGKTGEEAAAAHYWAAAAWGLWGMTHSPLAAVRKGVLSKVRHHARMVVHLDERYNDAAGLRILGRLHTRAPWVPFLSGWVDRREGIALLRRALAISRRDPENLLYLAEALLDEDRAGRDEALELLRELDRRRPRPDELVEDAVVLEEARELLAKLEGG